MAPALALHFAATFVGAGRAVGRVVAAAYVGLGALAVASCAAFLQPGTREWIEGPQWSALFVAACLPTLACALALLMRHLATDDAREKARTRLLLAAFAIGGTLDTVDVVTWAAERSNYDAGALGTLVAVALVAVVVFRLRLFDRDLSASAGLYATTMAVATVAMYLVVFRTLGDRVAPLLLATACVTVVAGFAIRELVDSAARLRAQRDRGVVLGRFAAQMAHDVKNPLAAIVGAARLAEDVAVDERQQRFLTIVADQAKRIAEIVDKYGRLGRIEAVLVPRSVAAIVRRAASAQVLASPTVRFTVDVEADDRTTAPVDEDLLAGAVENLVRNAVEAMPEGGSIVLGVKRSGDAVLVRVEDDGEGMDPRRAARAFEDFFTTKAQGSGLGLAFVRRVVEAHGGEVTLASRLGVGTTVELRLPVAPENEDRRVGGPTALEEA
jgi:signal transduction histidine kinase